MSRCAFFLPCPGWYSLSVFSLEIIQAAKGTNLFAVGIYEADGVTYAWLADTAKTSTYYEQALSTQGYVNVHGNTITFEEATDVDFYIMVVEGAELNNVKAYPVVVEGADEGNFYNDSIFDK